MSKTFVQGSFWRDLGGICTPKVLLRSVLGGIYSQKKRSETILWDFYYGTFTMIVPERFSDRKCPQERSGGEFLGV